MLARWDRRFVPFGRVCLDTVKSTVKSAAWLVAVALTSNACTAGADSPKPATKAPAVSKQLPPRGIEVPADKKAALRQELDALAVKIKQVERLRDPRIRGL